MTRIGYLLITLWLTVSAAHAESWRLNIKNADPRDAFAQLKEITGLEVTNIDADCLKDSVSYQSERFWKSEDREELIRIVAANACCDVAFGDSTFTLIESDKKSEECLRVEERIVYGNCEGTQPLPEEMIAEHPVCADINRSSLMEIEGNEL